MDKSVIARNFSKSADLYETYADVQRLAARELLKVLPSGGVSDILEIGCGTGIYTRLLRERFGKAHIEALDISDRMIETARQKILDDRIVFSVVDAERAGFRGKFDLVTSNACLHWFEDLEASLIRYKSALRDEGAIAFSVFGPSTFRELNEALNMLNGSPARISANNFLAKNEIDGILRAHFKSARTEEIILKREYPSVRELLRSIKYTGTRGGGISRKQIWANQELNRLEEVYVKNYGAIEATYQIFICRAQTIR